MLFFGMRTSRFASASEKTVGMAVKLIDV